MEKHWDYSRCAEIMGRELVLLNRISAVQNSVRQAVLGREWADFDWKMAEIRQLGREIGELDAERERLFGLFAPAGGGKKPFYELAAKLPAEERGELSTLYRTLKMETLKMRALNEAFLDYLSEAKIAAAAYLDAVFPARGGRLYTRSGGEAGRDLKSMVFNRHI